MGSNEKISNVEGDESGRLDFPISAKFTFSGLRIHDPQETGPGFDPPPPPMIKISPEKLNGIGRGKGTKFKTVSSGTIKRQINR